jgi:hypothetical protein
VTPQRSDRDVRMLLEVRVEQPSIVHAIEVIAGQNQVVLRVMRLEVATSFAHGVGSALKPRLAVGGLLGGEHVHEAARKQIHSIRLAHVAIERRRVELRQHVDASDFGVETVADGNVNQTVLAADRHRRL